MSMPNTDYRPLIDAQFRHLENLHGQVESSFDDGPTDAIIDATDVLRRLVTAALDDGLGWIQLNNAIYNHGMTDEDLIEDAIAPELLAHVTEIVRA